MHEQLDPVLAEKLTRIKERDGLSARGKPGVLTGLPHASRTAEETKRQGNNNDIREVIVYLDKDWGTPSSTAARSGGEAEIVTKKARAKTPVALSVTGKGALEGATAGSFEISDEEEEGGSTEEESKTKKCDR